MKTSVRTQFFNEHVVRLATKLRQRVRRHVASIKGNSLTVGELSKNGVMLIKRLRGKKVPFRMIESAFGLKIRNGNNAFMATKL